MSSTTSQEFQFTFVDENGNERSGTPIPAMGFVGPSDQAVHPDTPAYPPQSLHVHTSNLAPLASDSPFIESDSSIAERSVLHVRRYSDSQTQAAPCRPRSTSQPGYPSTMHPTSQYMSYSSAQYVDNTSPSSTTSGTFSFPSPTVQDPMKHFSSPQQEFFPPDQQLDGLGPYWSNANGQYDTSQTHITRIDTMAHPASPIQPSPILGDYSPASDTSGHEIQASPTNRGRLVTRRSSSRHSPYQYPRAISRSPGRIVTEMSNLSLEQATVFKSEPSPTGPYLLPPSLNRLDAMHGMLPELRSFDEVPSGPSYYGEGEDYLSHSPSSALLQGYDYPPSSNISPAELEMASNSSVRHKVGSPAIEKAANLRRKKAGEYNCDFPGCGATFTAKHNLNHHINSHNNIRNYKCACGRDFGTSHVLRRHQRKCNGRRRQTPNAS